MKLFTDHTDLGYAILEVRTVQDLNSLRDYNLELMNRHPYLFLCIRNARKRIEVIRRAKLQYTEIIFKN
jgi:hypothetical protein